MPAAGRDAGVTLIRSFTPLLRQSATAVGWYACGQYIVLSQSGCIGPADRRGGEFDRRLPWLQSLADWEMMDMQLLVCVLLSEVIGHRQISLMIRVPAWELEIWR
jgi:hypothetical protein